MPTQTPASAPRGTQKVSRSAVAAPARKPTTKQKKSAPPPRRRPKKPNIFVRFLHGLVRRLYFGSKTLFKFALFIPILVFMVWFSYTVDRSGLFQGELAPRRIVDLMLQGYDVSNFEQMNEIEREVVQLFAQDVPDTPEVIGVGSSRVLQFTRELVGTDSFFNMGVTGADVRDNMTSYYKMVCYGKAPKVLIWSVDPWVLYGDEAAFDKRADVELYNEFLTKVLGVETDYEEATLADFLEDIALVSETDKMSDDDNMVKLMTIHGSKGLEFPYVFLCGMEERIFPSAMAINSDDEDALEEERRLCYVGITRAMKKLYLSCARNRMLHGSRNCNDISRFIKEIPPLLFQDSGDITRHVKRMEERQFADTGYTGNRYGSSGQSGYGKGSYHGKSSQTGSGYSSSNPYSSYSKAKKEPISITPSTKPSFGKEFTVNRELVLDYGEGDRVRHMKFGNGTVTQLVKGGRDYEVTVDFDRGGTRKMFASFAKLKRLEE